MKDYILAFIRYMAGFLRDDDGSPSFSRMGTAIILGFECYWTSQIVRDTHHLPDFGGLAMFLSALMAVNRADNVAGAIRGIINPSTPQQK